MKLELIQEPVNGF